MANEVKTIAPKTLANELGIDPKRLRGYLRAKHTRPDDLHNERWAITPEVADAARSYFANKKRNAPDA